MEVTQDIQPVEQVDQEQAVQQLYHVAVQHMNAGKSDSQIQTLLQSEGASAQIAQTVVSELRQEYKKVHREAGRKDMLHGGLWFGGGLLISGATYAMASEGGSYFMTWGALVFGGFQFLKGLVRWMKN